MNPFLNPLEIIPFVKGYFLVPGRIERLNQKQLEQLRDKALRKMVTYAYTVPLYKKKYKEANIYPSDISGIKDIQKLPFISRKDIRENFPDGITAPNFNKKKGQVICTGGTTGKYCCNSGAEPVCIYTDFSSLLWGVLSSVREQRVFGFNWRKTKFASIGNYNPYKFDDVFDKSFLSSLTRIFSLTNYLGMQASDKTKEIIEKLDAFNPELIISYPSIFYDLSYFKRKGLGKNIKPKLLLSAGQLLDEFTKSFVEETFGCKLLNMYGSCESGSNIAFECPDGGWHIHSDYFHLEAVDENMEVVAPGERGLLVLTKLWGKGTPLIRYTGMEDWVTLGNGKKCTCGLSSPILEKPLEGRVLSNIILPNGKVYPPSEFLFITSVLKDLKAYNVRKFQIIQKSIDEIDILLVIDDDLIDNGPTFKTIAEKIIKVYAKEIGPKVKLTVKEVKQIQDDRDSGKPAPIIVSYVNTNVTCKLPDK